jgi:hypothetical protein
MSYIGNQPTSVAFLTDQFSGTGSQTAFTLSAAPANTASIIVAVSGVLQDPTTYSTAGLTLTFSAAPPSGTGNISVRFLGIPASNIATTAYRTLTEFTATAGQTTFTVPSYTAGYISVYRNGVMLGTADFTATNGTTVVLATAATAGDLITTESFYVSSVLNAIPATSGAVTTPYILDGAVTAAKMAASGAWAPAGTVVQVVTATTTSSFSTTSGTPVSTGFSASITPKFSTSKILVLLTGNLYCPNSGGQIWPNIYRNATNITGNGIGICYNSVGGVQGNLSPTLLDSPATTSSTTYTVYLTAYSGVTGYFNVANSGGASTATMTLLEVTA